MWSNWLKELSIEEIEELKDWTDKRFSVINNYLFNNCLPKNVELENKINILDKALSKFSLPKSIKVYRGEVPGIDEEHLREGIILEYPNYISTTKTVEIAADFPIAQENKKILMNITLEKSTECGDLESLSYHQCEEEILVSRAKSFEVKNVVKIMRDGIEYLILDGVLS